MDLCFLQDWHLSKYTMVDHTELPFGEMASMEPLLYESYKCLTTSPDFLKSLLEYATTPSNSTLRRLQLFANCLLYDLLINWTTTHVYIIISLQMRLIIGTVEMFVCFLMVCLSGFREDLYVRLYYRKRI